MKIYTDGGSRGNPGKSASAFVVYDVDKEIYCESKYLDINTNNFAEYSAVLMAVQWLIANRYSLATFYSDSLLMVNQLNGKFKIKNLVLQKIAIEIKKIILENKLKVAFNYVPREQNKRADELVNLCLDSH